MRSRPRVHGNRRYIPQCGSPGTMTSRRSTPWTNTLSWLDTRTRVGCSRRSRRNGSATCWFNLTRQADATARRRQQRKRNWHHLLDYNRHDCLALRHVTRKAAAELQSWREILKTIFCVFEDGREVCFTAGSRSRKLQPLLERRRARRWSFMTAWNPAPRTLSREENERRQRALIANLRAKGYDFLPGVGRAADGPWAEDSLLVLNISREAAIALARKFRPARDSGWHQEWCRRTDLVPCRSVTERLIPEALLRSPQSVNTRARGISRLGSRAVVTTSSVSRENSTGRSKRSPERR